MAAAADLQPVLPALAEFYARSTGVHVLPTFGSSTTLTQQLQNGAPEDLFLSADCLHPQALVDGHLADDPQPVLYAHGVLVLWARRDSRAQPLSLDRLRNTQVTHVAVANDLHAPYGQAATAAIRALHLTDALAGKLVIGENIMQTAQFAQTGNADAAFISLTIAGSPQYRESGSYVLVPKVYPEIRQCGVVLRSAKNRTDAHAFLTWLTSDATQGKLKPLGLDPAR